jgi:hypothetical protein
VNDDVLEREWQLLSRADPAARAVLAATNADDAYQALYTWSRNVLLDDPEMPHTGDLFCAWAELEDLYEIARSTPEQFHSVVRLAAEGWLSRPSVQSSEWLDRWATDTRDAVAARFKEDGTILDGKPL